MQEAVKRKTPSAAMGFTSVFSSTKTLIANYSRNYQMIDRMSFKNIGPLVYEGEPFSAIGEVELQLISDEVIYSPGCTDKPEELRDYDSWKYG